MFLLANVVDDMTMGITHVIRAEEHLPNTPKQQLLWEALGAEPPVWAHVPVVVNEKRQKLSKRRDKVALEAYRDEGYLADAMRNYLMLLGWAPGGDREIVPWSVIEASSGWRTSTPRRAFFDVKKLRAFNGEYIRALPVDEFVAACQPWLTGADEPRRRGSRRAFDRRVFAAVAAAGADPDRGARPRSCRYVDFLFLDEPADRRGVLGQGDEGRAPPRLLRRRGQPPSRRVDVGRRAAEGRAGGGRRRARPQAGQGAGAGPGGGHRPHRRPAAVRVARGARPRAHAGPAARRCS